MKLRVFLFVVFLLIGILVATFYTLLVKKSPGKPINNIVETVTKPTFSIENAPSSAVKGTITSMSGQVFWESRVATESTELQPDSARIMALQQGEQIQTGETGNMAIEFPNEVSIKILPKTQIDFVQTLPVNFVASIASGSATFKKLSNISVSIKSYHLLINLNSGPKGEVGQADVSLDLDKGLTMIKVLSGSITTAFNDVDLISHVVSFDGPKEVIFNDLTRSFEI